MSDAITIHAPHRETVRAAWIPLWSTDPRLPWDLGLARRGESANPQGWAEALVTAHFLSLEYRYTVTPTRSEALTLMRDLGFPVAPFGRVRDAPPSWGRVVVYTSEYGGHVGQDKLLLPLAEACREWPEALCTRYLPPDPLPAQPEARGRSVRLLLAGDVALTCQMISREWRSNVEAVQVGWSPVPLHQGSRLPTRLQHALGPLWAVDFVPHGGRLFAVDFNTSPGFTDGPTHLLPGGSFAGALAAWSGWGKDSLP